MTPSEPATVHSIVLIDDDADFLYVMKRRLQDKRADFAPSGPIEIHTFTDPIEALVNLPGEPICIVFLDQSMPGSSGLEWLPKVLKAGLGPAILMTSSPDAKLAAEAFRAGASDYISKAEAT